MIRKLLHHRIQLQFCFIAAHWYASVKVGAVLIEMEKEH